MKRLIPLLNKFVPDDLAEKGLSKVNPKLKSFFSNSARSGLGAGAALSFLRNSFKDPAVEAENARLKQGVKSQTLRPDEKVSARDRADQEQKEGLLTKAITLGAGALGGAGVLGSLGGLLGSGKDEQQSQEQQPQPKQPSPLSGAAMEQDIAAQNEQPEEFQDIINAIQSRMSRGGRNLEQAAQEVGMHPNFKSKVKMIEQSGVNFMDWVRKQLGQGASQDQSASAGNMIQGQSIGNNGASKQQFLAGLNQMGQLLQGLKR
jgi:hypothetical protein